MNTYAIKYFYLLYYKSLLLLLILSPLTLYSQINKLGVPLITNYAYDIYNASPQIWDIKQDNNGIIYAANQKGILEYDGKTWQKYETIKATLIKLDKILNHIRIIRSYKLYQSILYDLIFLIWFKILSNFIRVASFCNARLCYRKKYK